jgi:hypothetical protein
MLSPSHHNQAIPSFEVVDIQAIVYTIDVANQDARSPLLHKKKRWEHNRGFEGITLISQTQYGTRQARTKKAERAEEKDRLSFHLRKIKELN